MEREKNYKVSLLIPTYNSTVTLGKTLESIRQQFFSGVEVIVIDGGSTDDTLKIVESNRDLISKVVSEPDEGIYDAINKGIGLASGAIISVLGSDDVLSPNALDAIFSAWISSYTDIIAGQTIMVSPNGTESMRIDEDYGAGALLSGIPFGHNSMFATREAYERVGDYDLRYRICADADWVHRAIRLGCTCQQIEVPVVRFGLGGLSSNNSTDILRETYQIIAGNFPSLSIADAERFIYAIRGWSDGSDVEIILRKNQHISGLVSATATAFHARARRHGVPVPEWVDSPVSISLWQVVVQRIFQAFK